MKNKISNKIRVFAQQSIPATLLALLVASCGGDEKDYCVYNNGTSIVDKDKRMFIGCEDSAIRGLGLNAGKEWASCYVVCKGNNKLILEKWSCENPSDWNQVSNSCVVPQGACQYQNGQTMERPYEEMRCDDARVFDALRETVDTDQLTGKHKCSATCQPTGEIKYEYHGYNQDGNVAMLQSVIENKMHVR